MSENIKLVQLKVKDIAQVRSEILKEQRNTCPLCGKMLSESDRITLDHQHKNKVSDENGLNGGGLVRGVLCADCNSTEGKVWNSLKRYLGYRTKQERMVWLKNLIQYYEKEPYPYIHPSEAPKEPNVSKKNFNALNRIYEKDTGKVLEYPKSCKLTKKLKMLFEKYNIHPYN